MTLSLTADGLRSVRRSTVTWTRTLQYVQAHAHEARGWEPWRDANLANISKDAARITWGTPDETSRQVPKLMDYLNGVAYHAGTVDNDGNPKAPNFQAANADARKANALVQDELGLRAEGKLPSSYLW